MRRVLKAALFCLLAWVLLAPGGSAWSDTRHCSYQFYIGFIPAATDGPAPVEAPVAVPGAHFKVKGRFPGSCPWWKFYCLDTASLARINAAHGAERCARDSVNSGGIRPDSCVRKLDFGSGKWARVVEWSVGDIKSHAFQAICRWARERGQELSRITIWAVRERGWSSQCDIRGRQFFQVWQSAPNRNPCTRPVASDPTGGVGRPSGDSGENTPAGRPVPADPTGGLPPPPSHGVAAAPDLQVEKTLEKTCLPNQPCKFMIRVTNDGLGTFKGPLKITDTITPASERLTNFAPAPWTCEGGNGKYTCRHPELQLAAGQSVELSLAFTNTEKARGTVENCASIDWEIPPLEGICTAAVEEALARERETMSADAKSETDKAVKEYQCKSGVPETGKTDAQLLRLAFKSIGMGDTNRDNDMSCAASSVDIPLPETVTLTPEQTQCTGGRFRSRSTGECLCPSNRPVWDGSRCRTRGRTDKPPAARPPPPATATPTPRCTGGRFWDPRVKGCRCPVSAPAWNGKTCYRRITKPAPAPTTPSCSGGRYWDRAAKSCRCPSNKPQWDGKRCTRLAYNPAPDPVQTPYCTGGRKWDGRTGACRCPPDKPLWNGASCRKATTPTITPGVTTPLCRGGMYWNKKTRSCRCPSSTPVWNAKSGRCVRKVQTAPPKPVTSGPPQTYTPPTTTAPTTAPPTSGKIVCRGGQMVGALCWCGIGKFPKKVGKNVYQCQ